MKRHIYSFLLLVLSATPALLAAAAEASAPGPAKATQATPHFAVPFIQDDYTKAVAQARARKVPLFIEAWAPW